MASLLFDPVVQTFMVYSAILALKLLFMAALTTVTRMAKRIVLNPEDAKLLGAEVRYDNPVIERGRRAHMNDLENIVAFWLLGALYLTTGPGIFLATNLCRAYTLFRVMHSIVYAVKPLPQPARGIAYRIPYVIKWYMGVQVVLHYITAV